MDIKFCPLTSQRLNTAGTKVHPVTRSVFDYEFELIGRAVITDIAMITLPNLGVNVRSKLAGICRNNFEEGKEPFEITSAFIANLNRQGLPSNLREKLNHFLKYMYVRGGKDYQDFEFSSNKDYPISFATGAEEFNKVIKHLESKGFIRIGHELGMAGDMVVYGGVMLTDPGIREVQKELPVIPLITLAQQEIATGDAGIDAKLNHARKLFFDEPVTMDKMRSACETLSHILEPLRDELKSVFTKSDISDFFNIVNNFDIRHNKESTKTITHPEQLEWVFYTLLNSISTYVKFKKKGL